MTRKCEKWNDYRSCKKILKMDLFSNFEGRGSLNSWKFPVFFSNSSLRYFFLSETTPLVFGMRGADPSFNDVGTKNCVNINETNINKWSLVEPTQLSETTLLFGWLDW